MKRISYRRCEGIIKGFSNHRRIQILYYLKNNPDTSVQKIAEGVGTNIKTASAYLIRLSISKLLSRRMKNTAALYKLNGNGLAVLKFIDEIIVNI